MNKMEELSSLDKYRHKQSDLHQEWQHVFIEYDKLSDTLHAVKMPENLRINIVKLQIDLNKRLNEIESELFKNYTEAIKSYKSPKIDESDYEAMSKEERENSGIYACYNCRKLFAFDDMKELPHGPYCQDCYADIYG